MTLEGRIVRLVDRVAYINHDIDDAVRAGIITEEDLPAAEIELLGPTGSAADRHARSGHRRESRKAGDIAQSEEIGEAMLGCGSSCSSACTWGRRRGASTSGCIARCGALFDHYVEHPDEVPDAGTGADEIQRITDYIAGMTDRFCIAAFKRIALPEESRL